MQTQTLSAEVRQQRGKGPARQLRMRGLIPSIYYGPGVDPVKLTVSPEDLTKLLSGEYRRNQVIELAVGDERLLSVVKDLEIDPVTRNILHADFYAIKDDRAVETKVPLETTGRSVGVQLGGTIRKLFRVLPVRAFPQDVPVAITIDVSNLELHDEVKVEDLVLGDGVEVTYPRERRLLFIDFKEKQEEDETEATAEAGSAPDP